MAATEEEIGRIGRKLEKIIHRKDSTSSVQALDLLRLLQKLPISLALIQRTRIGLIVNNLRKSISDEEVSSLSKLLIKNWKKLLEKDNKPSPGENGEKEKNGVHDTTESSQGSINSKSSNGAINDSKSKFNNGNGNSSSSKSNQQPASSSSSSTKTSSSFQSLRQSTFPSANVTTDSIRLKCREMLTNALKPDAALIESVGGEGSGFYDPEQLASLIEEAIYKEFKDTNTKYKNRVRSRVSNLNDKKNPDLKINVLRGSITPAKIAVMTAEEMASNEMKSLRQKFTKEAIDDAQMVLTGGTKTDLLKCPACKKNNCTYNQVQTRSADEPMTTFCYCNECGKRWKFC